MIQGMTGFGSAEKGGFRVEVRSLNHRFMDVTLRMPPVLGRHEMRLRETLNKKFDRGKFDVYVSAAGAGTLKLKPNVETAKEIYNALNGLKEGLGAAGHVDMGMLLHWKDTFIEEEVTYDPEVLFEAFDQAIAGLEEMRKKEGEALRAELLERAASIGRLNAEVIVLAPKAMEATRAKILEKLKELIGDKGCEDSRLMQEAAAVAEKADIAEETSRTANHVEHMNEILQNGGTVGRKLDFLLQELNREANTIASKTDEVKIANLVIDMKAEIEKAREQAQNVQ
jgi:uncharacterized protein (TIGR00255 family)